MTTPPVATFAARLAAWPAALAALPRLRGGVNGRTGSSGLCVLHLDAPPIRSSQPYRRDRYVRGWVCSVCRQPLYRRPFLRALYDQQHAWATAMAGWDALQDAGRQHAPATELVAGA